MRLCPKISGTVSSDLVTETSGSKHKLVIFDAIDQFSALRQAPANAVTIRNWDPQQLVAPAAEQTTSRATAAGHGHGEARAQGSDTPPYAAGVDSGVEHAGVVSGFHSTNYDGAGYNQWLTDDTPGQFLSISTTKPGNEGTTDSMVQLKRKVTYTLLVGSRRNMRMPYTGRFQEQSATLG